MIKGILVLAALTLSVSSFSAKIINGAGASFPNPVYQKWFHTYGKANKDTRINYRSIGSGGGIRQLIQGTVSFGASDAPMKKEEESKLKDSVLHVPTVLGAVTITYNLDIKQPLKLTGEVIGDIFMGNIKYWNDKKIMALNPGVKFPDKQEIVVVHRSDGSGTTSVFSDYLAKTNPTWKTKMGVGKSLKWPRGIGQKGNEGITGTVKQTPFSIGYVELVYALSNKLPVAHVKNKKGEFVSPSADSVSKAAAGVVKKMVSQNFKVSITDAPAQGAYPISTFTWILLRQKTDTEVGSKLKRFLGWAIAGEGQKIAEKMNYAPLPKDLVSAIMKSVNEFTFKK